MGAEEEEPEGCEKREVGAMASGGWPVRERDRAAETWRRKRK